MFSAIPAPPATCKDPDVELVDPVVSVVFIIPLDVISSELIVPANVTLVSLNVAAVVVPDFITKLLSKLVKDPYCVPPSFKNISPPSASNIILLATSIVKSPDDKSISFPSIVILSTFTPASAVTTLLNIVSFPKTISSLLSVVTNFK